MTNSERGRYDTDKFVQELATMKVAASWRKPRLQRALAPVGQEPTRRAEPGFCAKKEPPEAAQGFSQGGVKSSGQEPLNVQEIGQVDNGAETLTYG
jgi:hypothetical protein